MATPFRFNPILSDPIAPPAALRATAHRAGLHTIVVRMLTAKHLGEIDTAAFMAITPEQVERLTALRGLSAADDAKTQATVAEAERRVQAKRAAHPSHGKHLPSIVRYGVVRIDDHAMTPEAWSDDLLDEVPKPLLEWMADEVIRFTGADEDEEARGEG